MSQSVFAVRHGRPKLLEPGEKLWPNGANQPGLTDEAVSQAFVLSRTDQHLLDFSRRPEWAKTMAASESRDRSSFNTAIKLGARMVAHFPVLDEIERTLPIDDLIAMAKEQKAPQDFINAGMKVIENPPHFANWILHPWIGMGILAAVVESGGTHNAESILQPSLATVEFSF